MHLVHLKRLLGTPSREPRAHSLRYPFPLCLTSLFRVRHLSSPARPHFLSASGARVHLILDYLPRVPCLFDDFLTLGVLYSPVLLVPKIYLSSSLYALLNASLIYIAVLNFRSPYCSLTVIEYLVSYYTLSVGTKALACT